MKNKYDCLIFDMDGVLIDVSKSYRKAIEKTVNYYLFETGSNNLISQKEVRFLKSLPGFNNDWDTTYRLLTRIKTGLKSAGIWPVSLYEKKTKKYIYLKDLFQNFYLGSSLYAETYKRRALITVKTGLIESESAIVSSSLLYKLNQKYLLAIATGRPRLEAIYTLKRFDFLSIFTGNRLIAMEDTSRTKPYPDPLIKACEKAGGISSVYIGDSLSDMEAAEKAGMFGIFIGRQKLGNLQINNVNQLEEIFL